VRSGGGNNADGPHGRRRSVEDPRLRLFTLVRIDRRVARNLGLFAAAWFLLVTAAVTGWWVFQPVLHDATDSDLTLVFLGARIGLEHGWSHIYSLDLQRQLFMELRPGAAFGEGERFLSPPPLAWLIVPLTALGPVAAYWTWVAISLSALVAAWWLAAPGAGWTRGIWLIAAVAWYPVLYSLALGQPDLLVLLAIVAAWRVAQSDRPLLAGVALALTVIKPQLALGIPLVLLAAGKIRVVAGFAITAVGLTLASLAVIGSQGLGDYMSQLAVAQQVVNNSYFTLAYLFGLGGTVTAARLVVAAAVVIAAYLNREAPLARLFAMGLVAGALDATYWHLQDYAILVAAAGWSWRECAMWWQRAWLLVVAVTAELAWPLGPLPVLISLGVWLVLLSMPPRTQSAAVAA
jgi:hypothetical protein